MTLPGGELPLLQLLEVRKHYPVQGRWPWSKPRGQVRAVDGVSLTLREHQTLSLVGESGSGKTTTARLVLKIESPTSGEVVFRGVHLDSLHGRELRRHRANVQAVFQDPWSSLNPRMRAGDIVAEPLKERGGLSKPEMLDRVRELLVAVGLKPGVARNFPHEFSGGQRQRVAIARALILRPPLIVLDEPVSALDVSVRAQVINLLKDLQAEIGSAYLLVAHDLATVRYLSHTVAAMYLGQIVEVAPSEELYSNPLHPYTQALMSASALDVSDRRMIVLGGEAPSPVSPPSGCRFHPRCPLVFDRCRTEVPLLRTVGPEHRVACHLY